MLSQIIHQYLFVYNVFLTLSFIGYIVWTHKDKERIISEFANYLDQLEYRNERLYNQNRKLSRKLDKLIALYNHHLATV